MSDTSEPQEAPEEVPAEQAAHGPPDREIERLKREGIVE